MPEMYTYADGTEVDVRVRAKQLADKLYDTLREKGLSHDEAIFYMENFLAELERQSK